MTSDTTPLWEFADISKAYPGVLANDKVCIKLMKGSIHGLLGENGCGKSTMIKTLSGVQQPDSGRILYNGKAVQISDPLAARDLGIATVFQEFSIVPTLSVGENIFLGNMPRSRLGAIDWRKVNSESARVLKEMDVNIHPEAITGDLSVGEQQLVEIAKAVAMDASMIILDEPTAALGEEEIEQLHQLLRNMRRRGTAILYVSHRLDEVERIVDEVTILRGGRVVSAAGETEINVSEIVSAMVGGDVGEHYPKENNATDDVVLRASGLRTKAGVSDATFDLRKGEVLGLGGVLGSGRTEIARALFGVDTLTEGSVELGGSPVKFRNEMDAIKAGMALVPENRKTDGLFFNFRASGNITAASLAEISKLGILDLLTEADGTERLIDELEISAQAEAKTVNFLSGGNQQKIVIARWLFADAQVLILDEPTQGIDIGAKIAVYKLMNTLTRAGKSIILISSDHDELLAMSDRVAVVQHGAIKKIVAAKELSHDDLVRASADNIEHVSKEQLAS
ncbi:sugar ABC transporter ATP-binding protein [Pelagimonas varians]|uniref:Galactose/methyl galactoside import ATP-binding protein MglA n=1 Tax=Pelagimonas varians TaxID=696760 RepID=A0A238K8V5_9RHOB|nr:sugar ABC transporter ATP-binding protein [Pelagimonas varians]PYG31835.1 monosaccharide ABC transporter ATP-binding protein (CUT2 family) [Pelagimonas varians]SMX38522.1 Galactose/methyl galactoside import ATP-binding protein MglA [Pelagimonas varians]